MSHGVYFDVLLVLCLSMEYVSITTWYIACLVLTNHNAPLQDKNTSPTNKHSILQSQKVVTAYLKSKQLLHFGFALQNALHSAVEN